MPPMRSLSLQERDPHLYGLLAETGGMGTLLNDGLMDNLVTLRQRDPEMYLRLRSRLAGQAMGQRQEDLDAAQQPLFATGIASIY